jgi:CheY-like chemotaxis protein
VEETNGFARRLPKPVVQPKLFDAIVDLTLGAPRPVSKIGRATSPGRPRLILLAEDNQPTQTMVLLQLQGLGYPVHTVSNGRQAVNAVSVAPSVYGLVLMDCQMPEMDGFSATRAIREAEAASGRHIPIIALTGFASEDDREKCLAAGMDDYISKPVARGRLQEVLTRWLGPSESEAVVQPALST